MDDNPEWAAPQSAWLARFQAMARATVERELAEAEARQRAGRLRPHQRHGANGSSSVFTVRLDHDERAALEARADAVGIKPSVLARNYIRMGLTRSDLSADEAFDRIDAALAEVLARPS